jgi:hypothetical protein
MFSSLFLVLSLGMVPKILLYGTKNLNILWYGSNQYTTYGTKYFVSRCFGMVPIMRYQKHFMYLSVGPTWGRKDTHLSFLKEFTAGAYTAKFLKQNFVNQSCFLGKKWNRKFCSKLFFLHWSMHILQILLSYNFDCLCHCVFNDLC